MIPESLKISHWLSKVPLPFATKSPRVQKANKGHKMYLGGKWPQRRHAGEYLRYGSVFYKVNPYKLQMRL